jgi:flavin reductase (DIM6/NTAB) family NADH-FMN oxidoreductase RutF
VSVDPAAFRAAMGRFATGVCVVTTAGPAGLTTNAVTSVSLDPLLLLVCFDASSRTLPAVRETGRFAVNVLREEQEDLARTFASKRVHAEKFEAVTHREAHGVPVLDDALAWAVCALRALVPAGDHVIGLGEVEAVHAAEGDPLVFYGGAYRSLSPSEATTSSSAY